MLSKRRRQRVLRSWRIRRVERGPVVQSEAAAALARRNRRRRRPDQVGALVLGLARRPSLVISLLAVLALVGTLVAVVVTGAHRVRGATVTGNRRVSSQAIYAASALDGHSAFGVDEAAAARRIEALDGIRHATVRVRLPTRVEIKVVETNLALLWQGPNGALAVDDAGLATLPPADTHGLARVRDEVGILKAPGEHIEAALVAAALSFAARFGELSYHPDAGFSATSSAGWPVRLGRNADVAARQLTLLAAVQRELASSGSAVDFVDLRTVNRPYYRLRGGSE